MLSMGEKSEGGEMMIYVLTKLSKSTVQNDN